MQACATPTLLANCAIVDSEDSNKPQPQPEGTESVTTRGARFKFRVSINAPFALVLAGIALVVMILSTLTAGEFSNRFLALTGGFRPGNLSYYFQLVLHPLAHASWSAYFMNFTVILLVGPLLEEKYGGVFLSIVAVLTAVCSGLLHSILFSSALVGASGIAFMMILLTSLTNLRSKTIPLSLILVVFLFMGREISASFRDANISQIAHIFGGLCGGAFTYWWTARRER